MDKEENFPRNQWPFGRVTKRYRSDDGHTRKVQIHRATSELDNKPGRRANNLSVVDRPIHKLVSLLEAGDNATTKGNVPAVEQEQL